MLWISFLIFISVPTRYVYHNGKSELGERKKPAQNQAEPGARQKQISDWRERRAKDQIWQPGNKVLAVREWTKLAEE